MDEDWQRELFRLRKESDKENLRNQYHPKTSDYKYAKNMYSYAKYATEMYLEQMQPGWMKEYLITEKDYMKIERILEKISIRMNRYGGNDNNSTKWKIAMNELRDVKDKYITMKDTYEKTLMTMWDTLINLAEKGELPDDVKKFSRQRVPKERQQEPEGAAAAPAPAAAPEPFTYYTVLGVNRDANAKTIQKAYYKLARERHPNVGGTKEAFQELQGAYEVLSNNAKRANYNRTLRGGRKTRKSRKTIRRRN